MMIIHTETEGQKILCDKCAIGYIEFCKKHYDEPPTFCTCEECMELIDEHDGCEMECSFCGDNVICRSMKKML